MGRFLAFLPSDFPGLGSPSGCWTKYEAESVRIWVLGCSAYPRCGPRFGRVCEARYQGTHFEGFLKPFWGSGSGPPIPGLGRKQVLQQVQRGVAPTLADSIYIVQRDKSEWGSW